MPRTAAPLSDARPIDEIAAEWLARRQGGLAPADEARLRAWLAADPRHAAAWAEVEGAWRLLTAPAASGDAAAANRALAARARARARRRGVGGAVAAATLAAAVAFLFFPARRHAPGHGSAPAPAASSIAPRPDVQTLADGSVIELNAAAEIAVEFGPALRRVRLVRGEALFTVAKDPARPFVVEAGGVAVRAVGTAFSVRLDPARVDVLVTEGRVAVATPAALAAPGAPADALLLSAGHRVAVPADAAPAAAAGTPVSPAEIEAALAWRGRRIEFSRTTLAEAAALFNARNRVQLALADPAIAGLRISGIFWSDDPEGFARLLATGFGVRVEPAGGTLELRGK
jgi:transmembrane sensor